MLKSFTYALNQTKMLSGGQRYRLEANNEGMASASEDALLPGTSNPAADVPNWSTLEDCTRYRRMLDACRFVEMLLDGQR